MFGRDFRVPIDLVLLHPEVENDCQDGYDSLDCFVDRLTKVFKLVNGLAREELQTSTKVHKHY